MISSELGIALGEKSGQVGKKMKALYSSRYGTVAASNIPKRATTFRGKPFAENTYYIRDKDLMEQAIREVSQ
ncbi:FirrV-1-P1 [Feldmannia irregularis virus a]|uniref:FirrV-1-P1 n=1 Tax=Feldmannia irregularis virus a TaxID=231992 RepID=Q6XLT2_9PHYC|nr:FirrV-1-P1 [Feldmannia irregularis virus a]AAR26979.1 FirrV-1-P1 [Feldmannia irregularis virus a]